jgi:hypothetical protein
VDEVWRGFKVEKSTLKGGYKPLYIDLGVVNLAKLWFVKQHIAVSGKRILSDGWYWTWDYGDQPPPSPTICLSTHLYPAKTSFDRPLQ